MPNPPRLRDGRRILVVEDDPKTAGILELYLRESGFEPIVTHDGATGLELGARLEPDLVILDLMLPGVDGWSICRSLRRGSDVPILILSARQEEEDRLLGLGLGADDYVVKPFSPREIVLRVRAILRRASKARDPADASDATPAAGTPSRERPAVALDEESRSLCAYGRRLPLTPSEYAILSAMMSRPGRTFGRRELLDRLYPGGQAVVPKVVDVHIGHLRKKLEPDPANPRHIVTVRGFGYRFEAWAAHQAPRAHQAHEARDQ